VDIKEVERTIQRPKFARDVKRYQHLIKNLHRVDVSTDTTFQRVYNGFFQLRRNEAYRIKHFKFLETNKSRANIELKEILVYLSSIQNSIEASFATKMLSTINPDMPVLDSKVLAKLGLKKPSANSLARIEETLQIYERICDWYREFYTKSDFTEWMGLFDKYFPNSGINPVKKIDFILWQMDN